MVIIILEKDSKNSVSFHFKYSEFLRITGLSKDL